ncbi:MAG: DUF6868 family protein [Candidatus Thiodiazotropha sp.]
MSLDALSDFFLVCSLINGGLLMFWVLIQRLAPELVYRTQRGWFSGSRERLEEILYRLLGQFKLLFLVFNLTPYLALRIIT